MKLTENSLYHIYNQGNNRRQIFYNKADYLQFLGIFRKKVLPFADVLAWCLMPNHFHFLLSPTNMGLEEIQNGNIISSRIGNGFRLLQTQYAQFLNREQGNTGSVFRQKAKVSDMTRGSIHYPYFCFHYIHQNPLRANLVTRFEDWNYSSYLEYCNPGEEGICNQKLAIELLDINLSTFADDALSVIPDHVLIKIRPSF